MIVIKTTCKNLGEARKITKHLLQKKLISSANYFSIKSTSAWSGEIKEVDEFIVLINTINKNWDRVKKEIKSIHSYKVPCIVKLNADASKDYETWISEKAE